MGQIGTKNKDRVPVSILDLQYRHVEVDGEQVMVADVTGEDVQGNTGVATVWLDGKEARYPPDGRDGATNLQLGVELLVRLGLDKDDPYNADPLKGKPAEFYCAEKEDANGGVFYKYYLNAPSGKPADAGEVKSLFADALGGAPEDDFNPAAIEAEADELPMD